MLTSKQRASLRSIANTLQPIFQIGKGGVTDALAEQLDLALEARELIKITILETCELTAGDAMDVLCPILRAEPVQCIGRKIVMYRRSHDNHKIEL